MRSRMFLVLGLFAAGCSESSPSLLLDIRIAPGLQLDQLQISAKVVGGQSFPAVHRPEPAADTLLQSPQSVTLLLSDTVADRDLSITVLGLWQGKQRAQASATAVPRMGSAVTVEVRLGSAIPDAGDGPGLDGPGHDSKATKDAGQDGCLDADKDGVSTCAGDCDDGDPDAHPGQKAFFTVPTKGKGNYDYNCDAKEEKQATQSAACVRVGSTCQGHGWKTQVPACGGSAVFVDCSPSGKNSCSQQGGTKVQACR